jgi:glycosyltransferase involved in cell wall biosynthesis
MARILLVEPFHGGSHGAWAEGLMAHSRHDVVAVSHPGAFWRWRMRGAALTLAQATDEVVHEHGPPDVVLVSAMVDLARWLGFTRRFLGDPAVVLYLHENQLAYPLSPNQKADDEFPLCNWMSMAAADEVWCNSSFQLDGLLHALPALLEMAPDEPHTGFLPAVAGRCHVVPVGVDLVDVPARGSGAQLAEVPLVLWNQRWDHDKNPSAVFNALGRIADEGVAFSVAVVGENVRADPREFTAARERLGDRVVQFGFVGREDYVDLLGRADVVVSAAHHEFFGIAVVEAMAAGCVPVLPNALSYPGLVGGWADAALYPEGGLTDRLREVLVDWMTGSAGSTGGPWYRTTTSAWRGWPPPDLPGVRTSVAPVRFQIDGVRVGHWTDEGARTGCTVVLFPDGTVASGEVRGGAPATREFDLLAPGRTVNRLDALVLSGGSAFGLSTADGVMAHLEAAGVGYRTGAGPVPIVVGLSLFRWAASVRGPARWSVPGVAVGGRARVASGWPWCAATTWWWRPFWR